MRFSRRWLGTLEILVHLNPAKCCAYFCINVEKLYLDSNWAKRRFLSKFCVADNFRLFESRQSKNVHKIHSVQYRNNVARNVIIDRKITGIYCRRANSLYYLVFTFIMACFYIEQSFQGADCPLITLRCQEVEPYRDEE